MSMYEREATSAILFASPAMEVHRRGEVRCRCCRRARARSMDCASFDFLEWSLYDHWTVDLLSQKMPTWQCSRLCMCCSRMSQCSSTPAISRSFIVILPLGFVAETKLSTMSGGHFMRHTIGLICLRPLIQTPPTPVLQAST